MTYSYDDPFESAANAQLPPMEVWGQVVVDAWFCVLQKGSGAVPFDPATHKLEERRTQIEMQVLPVPEMRLQFSPNRKMLVESREWVNIVLKSLKELGIENPRELQNKWAHIEQTPVGRTYKGKDGQDKEATTFRFLELFESEDACRASYLASRGNGGGVVHTEPQATAPQQMIQSPTDKERQTAYEFLKVLVKNTNGDEAALAKAINGMAAVNRFYTMTSPETLTLLNEQRAAQYAAAH